MNSAKKRWMLGGLAFGLVIGTAACGGGDGGGGDGPVVLEVWSDKAGTEASTEAFNAAHDDIELRFVEVPYAEIPGNLNNAHEAGDPSGTACLAASDNRHGSMLLAQGVIADIAEHLEPGADAFSDGAVDALSLADAVYGVPTQRQPIFTMFHRPAFEERGLAYPTTWEEAIEVGRELREDGVHIFNLAGEDPSTFMGLAWQAGARWYSVDGDAWRVDFTDDASRWAAETMQTLLDEDLVERISYAEYAAMMREYDQGRIAMRQLSTWQLAGHQRNMDASLGQWEPAPNLAAPGQDPPLSAADTGGYVVPALCEHPEEAVEAAVWLAIQEEPVTTMADPVGGSGWYPAVADPEPYADALVPEQLYGDRADRAVPVMRGAATYAEGWLYGPNSTAMYEELADQWGKAMNGGTTVAAVLDHMQRWTVQDLEREGIDVIE
ncbi:ABC transporter substrate-binding protein [Streptomyces radicis]|uniref:Extracellular solute-binding protein n=1 Tax=Streptomyces radicis TaxID=1750517 RepID=A0A3A9WHY1_9ACTN|nr:extracellular solute-binding protein [Streptomyces radicis]RKN12440.1 extracellular solute-binding protein [Streptomyces radicis]RKN27790.1 extracellular solute-binding protein [Streptomyces radicis]